ncbi:putative O-methyltransferase YrrM [Salibacterium salarium]|uniref:BofC N-terminal domain-containing protein n=1 Tax=Salibacterium salarium TaxID=284579 RepID=UPI00278B27A1|nr:BofC N-terminal domain-containing protein [Salibacterium salarium]MDQ0299844.1 putative O-methyltransferase YrrM [Salibacterium salarium]
MICATFRYVLFLLTALVFLTASSNQLDSPLLDAGKQEQPATYELILEKETSNGVVVTKKKTETVWAVEDFWAKYRNWEVIDQNQGQIILRKPYENH